MAGKGFRVPPLAVINLIKDNLADRYRDNYSVVKEIIQNADDAEHATVLDICWISGISNAKHLLLSGPALLFINNGIFKVKDATAIRQIGLSGKSSEKYSIGKFGLGLKSIFHLCEAFFYVASRNQPVEDQHRYNLVNPWSGEDPNESFHTDWDDLSLAPQELLENVIHQIVKDERWFCIWVPLRKKIHGVEQTRTLRDELIITDLFFGDSESPPDDLFNNDIEMSLASLLPLLQNIKKINLWSIDNQNNPRIFSSISLRDGSSRRKYPYIRSGTQIPFSGFVDITKGNQQQYKNIFFAGVEQVLDNVTLRGLQNSSEWPKTVSYGDDGSIKHDKEKADSHCAVYFVDKKSGNAKLDVQWSVFLPLSGDRTELVCDKGDFELVLHGYFFIDAGRSQTDFSNSYGSANGDQPRNIRERWNIVLKREGVYPLVLQALNHFVKESHIKDPEIKAITDTVSKSSLFKNEKELICKQYQWGYFLKEPQNEWILIGSEELFYELPATPTSAPTRHFEVFTILSSLMKHQHFLFVSTPRLSLSSRGNSWSENLLSAILDIDISATFSHRGRLEYFIEFLNNVASNLDSLEIQNRLISIIKNVFMNLEPNTLNSNRSLIQKFITYIHNQRRFALYDDESNLSGRALQGLQNIDLDILIVPKKFDPSEGQKSSGEIDINNARKILEFIAHEIEMQGCADEDEKFINGVLFQILASLGAGKEGLFMLCEELPIFTVYACSKNKTRYVGYKGLIKAKDNGLLFLYSMPPNRYGFANEIQGILTNVSIWLIKTELAKAVLAADLPMCDTIGVLELIARKPVLTDNIPSRARLVANIFKQPPEHWDDQSKKGMRYLFHAQARHFDETSNLLLDIGEDHAGIWTRVCKYIFKQLDREWEIIPSEISEKIAAIHWGPLSLVQSNVDAVEKILSDHDSENINFDGLSRNDRKLIIREVSDAEQLKKLRIHETIFGELVSIDQDTYIQGSFTLENSLLVGIKILTRFEDDPILASKQDNLCPVLNEAAAIKIVCESEKPYIHWRTVMNALETLGSRIGQDRALLSMLRETRWIPANDNKYIRPNDIIYIKSLQDDIARILSSLGEQYISIEAVSDGIKGHNAYEIFKNHVLQKDEDIISLLAKEMGRHEKYRIGEINIDDLTNETLIDALREIPIELMPSFPIINSIYTNKGAKACERFIKSGIIGSMNSKRMAGCLSFLAKRHRIASITNKEKYSRAFNCYLNAGLASLGDERGTLNRFLKDIVLLNRFKKWKYPGELCFNAQGIDSDDLLDEEQAKIFNKHGYFFLPADRPRIPVVDDPICFNEGDLNKTVEILRNYFREWHGLVQTETIGGFLSLLGNHEGIVGLAREYLGNFSVENFRSGIDWEPIRAIHDSWGGISIDEVMEKTRFVFKLIDNTTVPVTSLLGQAFDAKVSETSQHLLVFSTDGNNRIIKFITRGETRIIQMGLRKIDPNRYSQEELSEIIYQTAIVLLDDIFRQSNPNLSAIWKRFVQSMQLDIKIAQHLILESAFFYLRILGLHTHEKLKGPFDIWERARRKRAEEDYNREQGGIIHHRRISSLLEPTTKDALEQLKSLISRDEDIQNLILSAVSGKMRDHYQYRRASIPFEIFQNADDAVVELRNQLSDDKKTFVVSYNDRELAFAHRGRLINQFWIGLFDGRSLGYDRDLEKMLVLSFSDKPMGKTNDEYAVTGKFGLGFKSVFLATSTPKVLSGQLAFKVLGGIFPEKIAGDEFDKMKSDLQSFFGTEKDGTIFTIPLDDGINPKNVISEFLKYLPICLIFSKGIKNCELHSELGERHENISWKEAPLLNSSNIFIGNIPSLSESGLERSTAFVIKCKRGVVLLLLDAMSVKPIPKTIPTIWVTTPTKHLLGLGFAVNAPFDLDIGRAQLARESKSNQDIAIEMGNDIGQALCDLADMSERQWPRLREALLLADQAEAYTFWESFWKVFAESIYKQRTSGENSNEMIMLLESILWRDSTSGMRNAIETKRVLPSGLWGEYKVLTTTLDVHYKTIDSLDTEAIFTTVSSWNSFKNNVKKGGIISEKRIYNILNALITQSYSFTSIDLCAALRWEIGENENIGVEKAGRIGSVITRNLLISLPQGNEKGQKEYNKLQALIKSLRFRAKDGTYYDSRDLLIATQSSSEYREEKLRAAFAPDNRVLDHHYTGDAISLFEVCRGQMTAPVDDMVGWAIDAEDEKKKSVLIYLLRGEHQDIFGQKISQRLRGTWLDKLGDGQLLSEFHFEKWEQLIIIGRLRIMIEPPPRPTRPILEPKGVLEKIFNWWRENGLRLIKEYESRVYPDTYVNKLEHLSFDTENLPHNRDAREAWLIILFIGAFHTMGRTKDEQHRNFIDMCKQKGWMEVFSASHQNAGDWIRVIEEYFDRQVDDAEFYLWMKQFVSIFGLARWLKEYIEAFSSINKIQEPFSFDEILKSRTSKRFQGGGPSAPPISRILGIGACFVLRELVRKKLIMNKYAYPYCFVPTKRVRRLLAYMRCEGLDENNINRWEISKLIYEFLAENMQPERALFDFSFDIPLLEICRKPDLQYQFLGDLLSEEEDDG